MFDLGGRVAVITSGIGLTMAEALAKHCCAASIWGRNAEKNATAAASLSSTDARVHSRVCDVSQRVFAVNLDAVFHALQLIVHHMAKRRPKEGRRAVRTHR
jgi:NAD(P)-dependent dehydrogenase (short-subunit alcohol dehydrogenase family)